MKPEEMTINAFAICPEVKAKFDAELAKLGIDRRSITSAQNGKQGGRPHLRPEAIAECFLQERYSNNGVFTLRRHCGTWYEWRGDYWHARADGDIRAAVSGFLQGSGIGNEERLCRMAIHIHNQSGQVVALAMNKTVSIVVLSPCHANGEAYIVGGSNAAYPELMIDGFIIKRKHTHGDAPNLPMANSYELASCCTYLYEVALLGMTIYVVYGPLEHPGVKSTKAFVLAFMEI